MGSEAVGLVAHLSYSRQGSQASNRLSYSLTEAGTVAKPPRLMLINRGGRPNVTALVNWLTEAVALS